MNRIEIAPPGKATSVQGKSSHDEGESKTKAAGFQQLLRKLSAKENKLDPPADKPAAGDATGKDEIRPAHAHHSRGDAAQTHNPTGATAEDGREPSQATVPAIADAPAAAPEVVIGEALANALSHNASKIPAPRQSGPDASLNIATKPQLGAGWPNSKAVAVETPGAAVPAQQGEDAKPESIRNPFAVLNSMLEKSEKADDVGEPRPVSPMKMSVIGRETHFEPVARLSPIQQIATAVADEAMALDDAQFSRPTEALADRPLRSESAGPLKILHIKLEPDELGTVTLKMRLVGQSLELHLEASRAETAQMLQKDSEILHRVLRASGYMPDLITIQAGGPDTTQPQSGQSNPQGAGAQSAHSSSSQSSQSQGQQSGNGRSPAAANSFDQENAPHDDPVVASRADGNVYL